MRSTAVRKLLRRQRNNIKLIRGASRDNFKSDADIRWLFENRLRIIKMLTSSLSALRPVKTLYAAHGETRIMTVCRETIEKAGGAISEQTVISGINEHQRGGEYLTVDELLYLRSYMNFACADAIADCIKASDAAHIAEPVKLLFRIRELDFEQIYETVSYSESVLIRDPADVYVKCDGATKSMYRKKLSEISRRFHMGEYETAKLILKNAQESSTERSRHVGWHIQKYARHNIASALYFPALVLVPAAICALLAAVAYMKGSAVSFFAAIFAFLPIRSAMKRILEAYYASRGEADILPRLSFSSIPDEGRTLITFTVSLSGRDGDVFDRLTTYAEAYKDKNLGFAVLADLPDANETVKDADADIIRTAEGYIDRINENGVSACLLWRDREYSESERIFMGKERKRGAQAELFRLLYNGDSRLHVYGNKPVGYKYVLALDADTRILYNDIIKLIATALHPCNKPYISRSGGYPTVTDGYGVITPRADVIFPEPDKISMYTAKKYAYGGRSEYERASFDVYSYLFGVGSFCGKGLISVEAYMTAIEGAFPSERILSHDTVEGVRLRCGYASDLRVYDTPPGDIISERKRQHRWIRGDVQTWCLLGHSVTSESGEKYKNPVGMTGRMIIIEPVLSALTSVIRVPTILLSLSGGIIGLPVYLLSVSDHLFEITRLTIGAWRVPRRKYFSGAPDYYASAIFDAGRMVSGEADDAVLAADAVYRAFYRMNFTKRRLLEWKTAAAADSERRDGTRRYAHDMIGSVVVGIVSMLASFISNGAGRFILPLYGALWIAYPMWMHRENSIKAYLSKGKTNPDGIRKDTELMWRYFADNVTEHYHFLPPDNVTVMPVPKIAARTSPTNIGLYLLSAVNAYDLGFIDECELHERLSETLMSVCALERWHGHLYNWYDIDSMSVLYPAYVSTVDSGNFVVSLIAVKNALCSLDGFDDIIKTANNLISDADFGALYNKKRNLFYIGYNCTLGDHDPNVYDLYASEMLTTSFYAVASDQVPSEHLASLGRLWSDSDGTETMLSWSGSAFEYFMPSIFLPVRVGTARYESLAASSFLQRADSDVLDGRTIYGRSESSFYDFDDSMNYSYKAHGCDALALSPDVKYDNVIAPYALYLLGTFDADAVSALAAHRDTEIYGKYGFYEAVDMTRSRTGGDNAVVYQYMSHHIGMSITSAANICMGDINVKRFCAEPSVKASQPMLHESLTVNRRRSERRDYLRLSSSPADVAVFEGNITTSDAEFVSNGRELIVAERSGRIAVYDGQTLISEPIARGCRGFTVVLRINGEVFFCTADKRAKFSSDGASIKYETEFVCGESIVKAVTTLTCLPDRPGALCEFSVTDAPGAVEVLYFMPTVLNARASYEAAPSYSDIFITSERIGTGCVRYSRKLPNGGRSELFCSVFADSGDELTFHTRTDEILPFGYTDDDIASVFDAQPTDCDGACVHPVFACVVRGDGVDGTHKSSVFLQTGEMPAYIAFDEAKLRLEKHLRITCALSGADTDSVKCAMELADAILGDRVHIVGCDSFSEIRYRRDLLWRYGVSGDLPIVVVFCNELSNAADSFAAGELIAAKRFLFLSGIRVDMLFVAPEGGYMSSGAGKLRTMIESTGSGRLLGKNNGIFIIPRETLSPVEELMLSALSCRYIDLGVMHDYHISASDSMRAHVCASLYVRSRPIQYRQSVEGAVIGNGKNASPYSMFYANNVFGTICTNLSCGYSWYGNSSLGTVTRRHCDPMLGDTGERVCLIIDGEPTDLCRAADHVVFGRDCAVYAGAICGIRYELRIGVDAGLPVKLYHLRVSMTDGEIPESLRASLTIYPSTSAIYSRGKLYPLSEPTTCVSVFAVSDEVYDSAECLGDSLIIQSPFSDGECGFLLAASPASSSKCIRKIRDLYRRPELILKGFAEYRRKADAILLTGAYVGREKWLSGMMDNAAYQAVYIRMIARSGYSQSGGAYGFRDQLQDSLSALYFCPDITKYQILRACARQYTDGRVQHWWHPYPFSGGLKTRCSDDFMWLPYVAAEYVTATGDVGILTMRTPYRSSEKLDVGEGDRYETAAVTEERATVLEHCISSINASFERGAHMLPLIGSGDWNDGMNEVGVKGRGESVWLAFFYAVVYRKFAEMLREYSIDPMLSERLMYEADMLVDAAESSAWDGEWYLRAFDDDGNVLGGHECDECQIDLLPQAFAVFAHADRERCSTALSSVKERLFNRKSGILRLFSPPYDKTDKYGYICRYPAGIRENGGQYTHAAIWCAAAFFEAEDFETGRAVLSSVSPIGIYGKGRMNGKYTAEPYFIAADVYYGNGVTGHSGWSGYTGSASWFYRTVMKHYLGVKVKKGCVHVTPPAFQGDDYTVAVSAGGCEMRITVAYGDIPADNEENAVCVRAGETVILHPDGKSKKILLKVEK